MQNYMIVKNPGYYTGCNYITFQMIVIYQMHKTENFYEAMASSIGELNRLKLIDLNNIKSVFV